MSGADSTPLLRAKQRIYRTASLLVAFGSSIPIVALAIGDDPHRLVALAVDVPALFVCLFAYVALGRLAWVAAVERVMLTALIAFIGVWDVINLVLRRAPSAGDVVSNAPIFLLACILLCIMVPMRGQLRWLLALFGAHFLLTWANLLRVPWQTLHTTQITTDVITLVSVLLLSLIGFYQGLLVSAEKEADAMRSLARTDALTQLPNRRAMYEALEAHRGAPVLLIDLDDFKVVNDTFGHLHGDQVLIRVAQTLRSLATDQTTIGRWGGEEFVVVLPGLDAIAAHDWAERARRCVEGLPGIGTSLSIGLAVPHDPETIARLMNRADEQLYLAKSRGKNRVSPQISDLPSLKRVDHPAGG